MIFQFSLAFLLFFPHVGSATPLHSLLNDKGGFVDVMTGKTDPNPQNEFMYEYLGWLMCGMIPGAYWAKKTIRIADKVEFEKWAKRKGIVANIARPMHVRFRSLNVFEKTFNLGTRSIFSVTLVASSAVCMVHIPNEIIDRVIADPKSAYNTNEAFRNLVNERGWEPAIELLRGWRTKSIHERLADGNFKVSQNEKENNRSRKSDEGGDFFEDALEEVTP